MPDLVEMSDGTNENIIMYRWAFGGKAETLEELRANFAPGQDQCAYLVGKDAYAWDGNISDFILIGQWQGPVGPSGEGVPVGGLIGQVMIKSSNTDFEATWAELTIKTTAPLSGGGRLTDGLTLEIADATTTKRGAMRIATAAETAAGAKDDVAVCPVRLKELLDVIKADLAAINSMPVGTVFEFAAATPPEGAVMGDGSLAPIVDFPELFGVIGYAHTPDGTTPPAGYFFMPDYRDKFLRGHNPNGSRKFGSEQEDALQDITGSFSIRQISTGAYTITGTSGAFSRENFANASSSIQATGASGYAERVSFTPGNVARTAPETRPVNKTVLICIKY